MNRTDLIKQFAEKAGLHPDTADILTREIFKIMSDALASGESIEIRGFGSFIVKDYGAYRGRNPKSGDAIEVKPKKLPFFKPGKELKQQIDAAYKATLKPEKPKKGKKNAILLLEK